MTEAAVSDRVERKISNARAALLAEADPEEKRRLLKKIKKLRSRAEGPRASASGFSVPREATRIRHKWVK